MFAKISNTRIRCTIRHVASFRRSVMVRALGGEGGERREGKGGEGRGKRESEEDDSEN